MKFQKNNHLYFLSLRPAALKRINAFSAINNWNNTKVHVVYFKFVISSCIHLHVSSFKYKIWFVLTSFWVNSKKAVFLYEYRLYVWRHCITMYFILISMKNLCSFCVWIYISGQSMVEKYKSWNSGEILLLFVNDMIVS